MRKILRLGDDYIAKTGDTAHYLSYSCGIGCIGDDLLTCPGDGEAAQANPISGRRSFSSGD